MPLHRRHFLGSAAATAFVAGSWHSTSRAAALDLPPRFNENQAPVIILGGGLGGIAAALAVARRGQRVILTEETDWIGGQATAQAVPPDENKWVESFGCTKTCQEWRAGVRDYYRRHYPLLDSAKSKPNLNPGNGWVSRLCAEPRVHLAVLESMLQPFCARGLLTVLLEHQLVSADMQGDRVKAVTLKHLRSGKLVTLTGQYFLDATELGDLLPLAKVEHVTGAEAQSDTGEPSADQEANPLVMQGFTFCFVLEHLLGENHTIDEPAQYQFWKTHKPPQCDRPLLDWVFGKRFGFDTENPAHSFKTPEGPNYWTYRRVIDKRQFAAGTFRSDLSLINWGQNDYFLEPIIGPGLTPEMVDKALEAGKQLSLSLLYWLQTEAPRPDGGRGYPGLRLRRDAVGTSDGLAKYPYIRESRRIQAVTRIVEQHLNPGVRRKLGLIKPGELPLPEQYPDTLGIGHYLYMDLHHRTGGKPGKGGACVPFQIPLGSLLPIRVENVLAACKNLGTTQMTNGCYRLHTVEWSIGEAAGATAAFAVQRKELPRQIRQDNALLEDLQKVLRDLGCPIRWPDEVYKDKEFNS